MPTKRQHYVPRVYIKAWETEVETIEEPNKKFKGLYVFENSDIGQGKNKNSVLWKPHLYTIRYNYSFIGKSCPEVRKDFVGMVYQYLREKSEPHIYGKYGYSIIKTKRSIEKHFFDIDDWEFYYDDGNIAGKSSILSNIHAMNSYLLETSFDDFFEKYWETTYQIFISAVHNGKPAGFDGNEITIPQDVAINMVTAFFIMLCRNPSFDAMGIYQNVKERLLYPLFTSIFFEGSEALDNTEEGRKYADDMMQAIWYAELYKIFFKKARGFYYNAVKSALENCQMILFEAYNNAGTFITSDNPAFEHKLKVESANSNGMIFPISPKYLLLIGRGSEAINIVDHRFADSGTVKHFNRLISLHKTDCLIADKKFLSELI